MSASTEIERHEEAGGALANRRLDAGLAEDNGIINVARWQMLSAIAETVTGTEFVPKGLRDSPKKVLACLLYGDALGMQPMSSLKEIHVIDGTPGLSAAAMQALVRRAHPGHRIKRIELRDDEQRFIGVTVEGLRGDTGETDSYTFTLDMAARAALMGKDNWKKYPEAMCSARALSQICTFLFPDVFMGSPYVPEEIESFGEIDNVVEPAAGEHGGAIVKPPTVDEETDEIAEVERDVAQGQWEVADADTGECITYISADDRRTIAESDLKLVRFPEIEGKWEVVGYEVEGASGKEKMLVRAEAADPSKPPKPAEGTPAAVVGLNIPDILGKYVAAAQERGDVEFVRGVLEAEKAGKARARLVTALEGVVETMESDTLRETLAGDGTGDDNPLLDEEGGAADGADGFLPLEDGANDADEPGDPDVERADALDPLELELHPDIPFASATQRAKVARLKAFCAVMEDQWPEQRVWRLEGVVASAAKQWGGGIESIEDLDEDQLEKIWQAAAAHAPQGIEFLALASPADVAKMAASKEQS